jgi:hypothetical protein
MKVELLGLCASATKGAFGELNILGLTDVLLLPQFPAAINCCLVIKMRFQSGEEGMKEIKISIVNVDGVPITNPPPPVQRLNVQIPPGSSSAIVGAIQGIGNLHIPTAGQYQVGLFVNQREEATILIHAYQPPQFQKPLPPQAPA